MTDYFNLRLPEDEIRAISSIGLAHLGDGVYELLVRAYPPRHGGTGKGPCPGRHGGQNSPPSDGGRTGCI